MFDVILVDDEPRICELYQDILSPTEIKFLVVETAEAVLDKIKSDGTCILVTDIKMPGMSGIELAQKVHETNPELPIVALTGSSCDIELDPSDFCKIIQKPVTAKRMLHEIRSLLLLTENS